MTDKASDLVSVRAAAKILDIHPGTLRTWLSQRRLPYIKVGRLTKLRRADLDNLIAEHTVDASPARATVGS